MSTAYEEFINQVKKTIQEQPIPPIYNPDEWEDKTFNCYLYVLRACMELKDYNYNIAPGFILEEIECKPNFDKEYVLRYLKKDCEVLGLNILPSEIDEPIGEDEYKIAVYVFEENDYHFARQDSNRKWSEKNGWRKGIEVLEDDEVAKDRGQYKFIGIFRVSKKVE